MLILSVSCPVGSRVGFVVAADFFPKQMNNKQQHLKVKCWDVARGPTGAAGAKCLASFQTCPGVIKHTVCKRLTVRSAVRPDGSHSCSVETGQVL